jgi:Glycosyltransferase family 10 (fucosyltransferase) C-term
LKACANARFLAYGTTWITDLEQDYSTKTKNISLVASKKWKAGGHRLRHSVVRAIRKNALDVDVMGRGYKPFDDKADALADYRYSIVIENSRTGGYFTEKLIDSFICLAVPIYWGAPDITHFFDPRGMIICSSKAEIIDATRLVDVEDYNKRLPYLIENKHRALSYVDYNRRIGEALETDTLFSIHTQQTKSKTQGSP